MAALPTVRGGLDELLLGELEPLRHALAALGERPLGLGQALAVGVPADLRRLRGRRGFLLGDQVVVAVLGLVVHSAPPGGRLLQKLPGRGRVAQRFSAWPRASLSAILVPPPR